MSLPDAELIRDTLMRLLAGRSSAASICPSDVARALAPAPAWRSLMPAVIAVARDLADRGEVRITQGSEELAPDQAFVGPIRVRRGARWSDAEDA